MKIKILGSGCRNCKRLENNTKEALKNLGIDASIEKIEDFKEIASYGVMQTPALVVDEEVRVFGKVSTVKEIKEILKLKV